MTLFTRTLAPLALIVALGALAAPASADDLGNINAFVLAPVGNVPYRGIDYGLGYRIIKLGPVSVSPLLDVASIGGTSGYHFGIAATVDVAKHVDVGIAEVQRPDLGGFTHLAPSVVIGLHI